MVEVVGDLVLPRGNVTEEELCMMQGNITEDGGIRVLITQRGRGWQKPSDGDEALLTYRGVCMDRVFTAAESPVLVTLGQSNRIPHGLERALTTSFTRHSHGHVWLSPRFAFAFCFPGSRLARR